MFSPIASLHLVIYRDIQKQLNKLLRYSRGQANEFVFRILPGNKYMLSLATVHHKHSHTFQPTTLNSTASGTFYTIPFLVLQASDKCPNNENHTKTTAGSVGNFFLTGALDGFSAKASRTTTSK